MVHRDGVSEWAGATPGASRREWVLVIPVKASVAGKSRLRLPNHSAVAKAIALDTIEAAADCDRVARVLVVTPEASLAAALAGRERVIVVQDPSDGLRAAINIGLSVARMDAPRAVLLGDLPALKPAELSQALALAARSARAFVADADGTGTVLATALSRVPFRPLFGLDSAAAHRADGFVELKLPAMWGLRRDLDTVDHLPALRRMGLGRRTAALLG